MAAKVLHLTKDPMDSNGPELIAYLDALDADVHNHIESFKEQLEASHAVGDAKQAEHLAARITEYEAYRDHHARLRAGVYEDFPHDFLPRA